MADSRNEKLLNAILTGDASDVEPPQSRVEELLHLILQNLPGGDSQITNISMQMDGNRLKVLNDDTVLCFIDLPFGKEYTIAYRLTNCSMNNDRTRIFHGESYGTMFTPETGFDMDSIVVTMGGIDITSDVLVSESSSIIISHVFGNLDITASAVKTE